MNGVCRTVQWTVFAELFSEQGLLNCTVNGFCWTVQWTGFAELYSEQVLLNCSVNMFCWTVQWTGFAELFSGQVLLNCTVNRFCWMVQWTGFAELYSVMNLSSHKLYDWDFYSIYSTAVCPKSCFAKILLTLQGNIVFFYNHPPAESDIKELRKLFRLLSTMYNTHLLSPKS